MKAFLKGLRLLTACLLCIPLILTATAYPLYFTISSFAGSQKMAQLLQEAIPTVLPDTNVLNEVLPLEGLDSGAASALWQSDAVGELLELYTQDVLATVLEGTEQNSFTAEALKELVNDNMSEVVDIIHQHLPEDSSMTTEDITEKINETVDANAEKLVEAIVEIAPAAALSSNDDLPLSFIRSLLSPQVTLGFLFTMLFCAALIVLCRLQKWRWMKWLAASSLIVASFTGLTAILSSSIVTFVGNSIPHEMIGLISLILDSFQRDLVVTTVITFVLGIGLIVSYAILRRKKAV